jgi:GMP synthase-like glutamine amidotransferase
VERTPNIEIGVVDMMVSKDAAHDPVFGSLAGTTVASSQWHQDYISRLPNTAVVLMSNADCPVQAFRVGKAGYGVQFHPEVDAVAFKQWASVSDEAGDRSGIDVMAAADEVAVREASLKETWRPIFHAFADVVKSV